MGGSQGGGHYGSANGTYMASQPADQEPTARPFTLQEALPYSPQTSVIPFTSDLIPDPTIGSGLPSSSIAPMFSSSDFDTINRQASSLESSSKHFKHATDQILQELRPNQRTFYKFKQITKPLLDPSASQTKSESMTKGLSPLTTTVLDRAPTFIKQGPVDGAGATLSNGRAPTPSRPSSSKKTESPKATKHAVSNAEAHSQNSARIEVAIPKKPIDPSSYVEYPEQSEAPPSAVQPPAQEQPTPTTAVAAAAAPTAAVPTVQASSEGQPVFAVELLNSGINKDEYLDVPDEPDEPAHLSERKRKRDQYNESQDALSEHLNQRQRAETAVYDLGRLTKDVFDSVGNVLQDTPGYSHIATLTSEREPALTAGCHQKLQTAVQKVISLGAYDQVPLDTLIRIQKLSEVGLKVTQSLDYKVDDSWSDSDVQSWLDQLPDIETGLKAARTTLRVMCGGREEKQLYSEETIQQSIDLFKGVIDGIVVPVVELRAGGTAGSLFKMLHPHKKTVASVLTNCQRLFALFTTLIQSIQLSDMAIGTLEFSASSLIFVDNAYYEKDSVVGVQKFDGIRLVAMDMLCQIFLMKPGHRQGIFNDLLTSLEKLPVGKQSARQFRLAEGGSIQPLSALIMRLVQASSGKIEEQKQHAALPQDEDQDDDDEDKPLNGAKISAGNKTFTIRSEEEGAQQHDVALQELIDAVAPLTKSVRSDAHYVVKFIVNRALKSTKSGDTPYRNLLDLFVEDFTTCLDSPDWPAAELVLRQLFVSMQQIWDDGKSAAPAKNMALELLGIMGAALSKLRSHVRKVAESKDGSSSDELARFLSELAMSALEQNNRVEHVVAWSGPYRATLEYLEERCAQDPHLRGAISYLIADWAQRTHSGYVQIEGDEARDQEYGRLAFRLRMMIEDRTWLSNEYTFKTVSQHHAKLSFYIVLLRSPFAECFGVILNILMRAMASDQATVRSKSLKSINQLLETDPAILDGESAIVTLILNCSNDSSPQVRDSAIGLMGKCINLRSNLESKMTGKILDRFIDSGVGVRKRAMKLARDIYLRNQSRETRSAIANAMLHRVQDPDEGVRDLARQMIEEVWFAPFYNAEDTPTFKTSLTDHVSLMIQTVKSGNVTGILDKVLQSILSLHKTQYGPFGVSIKLVQNMFELIDNLDSDDPSIPHGRDALQVLQIFAKADAKLFTFEEIRLLKPHLASFNNPDDLAVFKAVTSIYRQVLPQLSSKHTEFLKEVRDQLQKSVGKLSRHLLDDVVACLWIIAGLLDNRSPLARLGGSSLAGTAKLRQGPLDEKKLRMFARYSEIVGMVGKHCDLDAEIEDFKGTVFSKVQATSVAKLMVDQLSPWADASQPLEARRAALDAIGLVCQAHPRNYVSPNVYPKFEKVFKEQSPVLEAAILRSFKEFLLTEERRSEAAGNGAANGTEIKKDRNLTIMGGTNYDDVASATTQRFLSHITRIALSTLDEHSFLAVEVLGSINRQGLVHPKETGVTLITLETSPIHKISEVAYMEHRSLHEKHETVVEREYVKAVQAAFNYQRDVVKDTHGATTNPFQSKLHLLMEVLKVSKSKNRQKFLSKLIAQIDFEPGKLEAKEAMPQHVEFARFIIENLGFFEYMTVGEVLATVNAMEKLVTSTGSNLAHIIESEVFNMRMDINQPAELQQSVPMDGVVDGSLPDAQPTFQPAAMELNIDPGRLRQLTAGAIILLSLWEARTYLRRLYSLGNNRKETKAKASSKDMSKAPIKVQGITGDKFWEEVNSHMDALSSQQTTMEKCRAFVELLNVDKEFKVADDDDDMNEEDPATPSEGEEDALGDGRGRKRKAGGGTPGSRKKRARSTDKPRPRGRPRKNPLPAADEDADGDFDLDDASEWL